LPILPISGKKQGMHKAAIAMNILETFENCGAMGYAIESARLEQDQANVLPEGLFCLCYGEGCRRGAKAVLLIEVRPCEYRGVG
jgi:hypothetical protein